MKDYIAEFMEEITIPVEYINMDILIKDIILIKDEDYEIFPDDFEFEVF